MSSYVREVGGILFSSYVFILEFLPIVLLGFDVCSRFGNAASVRWLLLASFVFYGYWNPIHLSLIAASILVNFQLGKWLASEQPHRVRRFSMLMGVALNPGLIAYFKYFGFFADVLASVSGRHIAFEELVLPLWISFFIIPTPPSHCFLKPRQRSPSGSGNLLITRLSWVIECWSGSMACPLRTRTWEFA